MTLKRIHINRHHLVYNRTAEIKKPVITVKTSKTNTYCDDVEIKGPSKVVHRPEKPMSCGAVVWIETTAEVVLDGKASIK